MCVCAECVCTAACTTPPRCCCCGLRAQKFTIDIRFDNLGLLLKGSGKAVMQGVTGASVRQHVTLVTVLLEVASRCVQARFGMGA